MEKNGTMKAISPLLLVFVAVTLSSEALASCRVQATGNDGMFRPWGRWYADETIQTLEECVSWAKAPLGQWIADGYRVNKVNFEFDDGDYVLSGAVKEHKKK